MKFLSSTTLHLALILLGLLLSQNSIVAGRFNFKVSRNDITACEAENVTEFLAQLEPVYTNECSSLKLAKWNYMTDITDGTMQDYINARNGFLDFQSETQLQILQDFSDCFDDDISDVTDLQKRELRYLGIHGPGDMNPTDYEEMTELLIKMESSHATTKVCEYNNEDNCELYLEPDVEKILQESLNPAELEWYWTQWHDQINSKISVSDFTKLVTYQNQWAEGNGFSDMSQLWLQPYDDETDDWTPANFKETMNSLWNELKPYYNKLHAFVRMQLRNKAEYRASIKRFGSLPLHLTKSLWSNNWLSLDDLTKPWPELPSLDATEALRNANYTIRQLFDAGNQFLEDIGLDPMPSTVWTNSIFERPDGKEFICDAMAEDMCTGSQDFRLKLCADPEITMKDLLRVTKYTGHIEYFMQYANLNYIFRSAANPAFFDGISNTFSLITSNPHYLVCKLELDLQLEDFGFDCNEWLEESISQNFLYRTALEKFPLLAFAMTMNEWRWEVFENKISPVEYNKRWYELRQEYQGVVPPTQRDSVDTLDPLAIFNILSEDDEFTKAFVGNLLEFRVFEELCKDADEYDPSNATGKPLHLCDFSGNELIGNLIKPVMQAGFQYRWTMVEPLTTSSIIEYFKPLFKMIDERLLAAGESPCFGKDCQAVAKNYVEQQYEIEASLMCNNATVADWNYVTDLTNPEAEAAAAEASRRYSAFLNAEWKETISQFDLELFDESSEKRQLTFLNAVGVAALEPEKLEQYNQILSNMSKVYGTARVCPYNKRDCDLETEGLTLEPGLENIMANSRHYNELAYIWRSWRDVTGKLMRDNYNTYLDLSNEAAVENGYDNMGDFWLLRYESDTFKQDMQQVWETVKEIYVELHAYVRYRLSQTYPQLEDLTQPLPAHILGNMWGQTWNNIYSLVVPFPDAPVFDVTQRLKELFTDDHNGIRGIFNVANGFFTSLGLDDMAMAYGDKAMIVKPTDGRDVICHASAWDFCDGQDFRIKQCTNLDMEDFITVHHELGHIQYYLQYKHLNITFREGANPGFHEAIGDVVSLSVATPKHMYKIGLADQQQTTFNSTINYLMKMALDKIAFLPFGFLIDSYRWKVFDGQISRNNLTYEWLKMRNEYQGIVPPFVRDEDDFDAGAKYHVPANVPYIRYFVSYILQFQIHKELCIAANEYVEGNPAKPLHNCDIYRNVAAGQKFKAILQAGGSTNWQDLLEGITGGRNLNATALLNYFKPLTDFLKEQREQIGYEYGWDNDVFENYYGDAELPTTREYPTPPEPTTTTATTTTTTSSSVTDDTDSTYTSTDSTGTTESSNSTRPTTDSTGTNPTDTSTSTTQSSIPTRSTTDRDDDVIKSGSTNVAAIVLGVILGVVLAVIGVGFAVKKFQKPKGSKLLRNDEM